MQIIFLTACECTCGCRGYIQNILRRHSFGRYCNLFPNALRISQKPDIQITGCYVLTVCILLDIILASEYRESLVVDLCYFKVIGKLIISGIICPGFIILRAHEINPVHQIILVTLGHLNNTTLVGTAEEQVDLVLKGDLGIGLGIDNLYTDRNRKGFSAFLIQVSCQVQLRTVFIFFRIGFACTVSDKV